ncbi:MAG: enoyl-ACP reductase FabI [Rickettsiales bacterium]|nr:enoyl-ACP reductase FabI [Rickettsiales bacterium]
MSFNDEKIFNGDILKGKKGLIMGVANDKSIAWGIAKAAHAQGAELAFSYQGEVLEKRVKPLAESIDSKLLVECDVTNQDSIDALFDKLKSEWGSIDFVVHAIAYSDKNELKGRYVDTSLDNFMKTMHISCFSFTAIARKAAEIMNKGGSLLTLSYYGAEKVMPHYNVMGVAKSALESSVRYLAADLGRDDIRVNAISAGPLRTLAAAGIGDFRYMLKWNEYNSPLKRNVTTNDVGRSGLYLISELSSGVTGEILYVDSGFHVVGMKAIDAPDLTIVKDE